ncbi:MAG: homoserine kinase [Burkholderiaceae bacterium]|jgi:homoserine kinase type II|nr:homoserine kinase [Burkholderiaceae bacterium]
MAVFTEVSQEEAAALMARLGLGQLTALRGIEGGIENTNYFVTTDQGQWVLTLFERLTHAQLPFYLRLMKHLARRGIAVPEPQAKPPEMLRGPQEDDLLHTVAGKPAAVVNRLRGASELEPTPAHCAAVGAALARAHLAARDFEGRQPNLRGLPWWNETVPAVLPFLDAPQAALITSELAYQNHVAASSASAALPRGAVHADLFRDNVMFGGTRAQPVLTGFFDYYFAGVDTWLFDLAVALNDWAVDWATGRADAQRTQAMLQAYESQRRLGAAERRLLPAMARAGALRFWLSRLWDLHLPRQAALLVPHDPAHFERVLRERIRNPLLAAAAP